MAEPYCGNCGYTLVGLTESSRCPECGKPLVEVLQRRGVTPVGGRRYESSRRIFGLPLVSVAYGPDGNERIGRARGIIARGDVAIGVLAIGGQAFGVIALGGMACGIVAVGGLAIGLLAGFGGAALGGVAIGGAAIGGIAHGGGAIGIVAEGGGAIGCYARGGSVLARHAIDFRGKSDPEAVRLFEHDLAWLLGRTPRMRDKIPLLAWLLMLGLLVAAVSATVVYAGYLRQRDRPAPR